MSVMGQPVVPSFDHLVGATARRGRAPSPSIPVLFTESCPVIVCSGLPRRERPNAPTIIIAAKPEPTFVGLRVDELVWLWNEYLNIVSGGLIGGVGYSLRHGSICFRPSRGDAPQRYVSCRPQVQRTSSRTSRISAQHATNNVVRPERAFSFDHLVGAPSSVGGTSRPIRYSISVLRPSVQPSF